MTDKKPIYLREDTNCMDEIIPARWCQELICSDGRLVLGFGKTAEESTQQATVERNKVEDFLSLSDEEQLRILVDQKTILSSDTTKALKLIAKILLKK